MRWSSGPVAETFADPTAMAKAISRLGGANAGRTASAHRGKTQRLIDEMPLQALRRALNLTNNRSRLRSASTRSPSPKWRPHQSVREYLAPFRRGNGRRVAHRGPFPQRHRRNQPVQAGAGTDRTGGGVKRASGVVSERLNVLSHCSARLAVESAIDRRPGDRLTHELSP